MGCIFIIYLDNSATTKPCEKAIKYMNDAVCENWGNPSSLHLLGMNAEIAVDCARECVAKTIGAQKKEIIFTSGGTEANNTAIMSALHRKNRGNRIITTSIEHPSVLNAVDSLEKFGFEIIKLKPDSAGVINLLDLENALNEKTVLVSIMLVNNEVGAIEPIKQAGELIRKKSPNAFFHCDAVQGFGKMPINVRDLGVDMLSASGHKIHAPKGIGFLYCSQKTHIAPLLLGGGQENGMRSGTESVPLIMALQGAIEELPNAKTALEKQRELFDYTKNLLCEKGIATINSTDQGLPFVLNVSVNGYRSETLLHFLESKNVFVSSGSACSKGNTSYVLKEMGKSDKAIDSALRISFSRYNTKEEIDVFVEYLLQATKTLRKA
ncbi:MAG: cysteine desulfurase [Ruminococcaceae bacterium]|nr:cysteine desulfurase [Oscillospiraceae bacterium]